MTPQDTYLLWIVALSGFYMAWNIGANDVANAMGTSVGSGALTLRRAVLLAAVLEFCGAFFFGSHVSETFQNGIVDFSLVPQDPKILVYGMLSTLIASGIWLQVASYKGWPVSTTHSIVGALVGFAMIYGGAQMVHWPMLSSIVLSWVLSPVLGGVVSYFLFSLLRKQIFYQKDPLVAAKRITPLLVFFVTTFLVHFLGSQGLAGLHIKVSFWQMLVLSLSSGFLAFCITHFALCRIVKDLIPLKTTSQFSPEVSVELKKTRKHLLKVKAASSGEFQYQVNTLLEEIGGLSNQVERLTPKEEEQSAFLAIERIFSYLQIISACLMAFAHGANDVANAIGPLSATVTLLQTGSIQASSEVPAWTLALGGAGIVVGLATWGWRVILTIGNHITELTPTRGFTAEFSAAVTVLLASRLGLPISTTHTLVGSVVGVGLARGIEALNMNTTRNIAISWFVTVPAGAFLAIFIFSLLKTFF